MPGLFSITPNTIARSAAIGSGKRERSWSPGRLPVDSTIFSPVHPTGQKSKKCPQVEGHVVRLSGRHAKLRRAGYRNGWSG
jgi:hypothetical protein